MWSTQMRHTDTGAIGGNQKEILRKKYGRDWSKVMGDRKSSSDGREKSTKYCQRPYIDIDIDIH